MADHALSALESIRQQAVQAAQQALAEARAELAQHEALLREANVARARCDEELQSERAQLVGGARTALALRRAEDRLRGLELELRQAGSRLAAAQQSYRAARARVEQARVRMAEEEGGRRAVAHVLGEHKKQAEQRRELREEDDAADAWHAQRLTPGR